MISLQAPAKINLSFEVLGRRADGYHEVRTVLAAVDIVDELELTEADALTLTVEPEGAAPVEDNLVLRAALLLREAAAPGAGAAIVLRKRIPLAAGLGGGSSDAAAALLGLRRLWDLDLSDDTLVKLAAVLGADVPFFLRGGTAVAAGRGEELTPLPQPLEGFAVVVAPEQPAEGKTARLYDMLGPQHFSDGGRTAVVARRIRDGVPLGATLSNAFEAVAPAAYASYEPLRSAFADAGARPMLSGAGPAMFALAAGEEEAEAVRERLAARGYTAWAARLLPGVAVNG
ncbi:MAG: 4-(cytidine 5'-diphospho)-2-C-methyl-D-erythritol kinase [Chloroflexi bacterium]|nr:4-(cytidine 5'-diphospho)-2-C-methyl-D-erythritol kinase [Chloroflexota bacterium]